MKHPILISVMLLLFAVSLSAQKKGDAAAVEGLIEMYQNSLNEGSLEGVLSVFSSTAVVLPPNAPPAADRAAIEGRYTGIMSSNIDIHMSLRDVVYGKEYCLCMAHELGFDRWEQWPVDDRLEVARGIHQGRWSLEDRQVYV